MTEAKPGYDAAGWPEKKYTIVGSLSEGDLCEKVCIKIAEGWRCQGGMAVVEVEDEFAAFHKDDPQRVYAYHQAMVRDVVPPGGNKGFYGSD